MQAGDFPAVEKLINSGAPVSYKDELGLSPILWAACQGHDDVVERIGLAKDKRAQKKTQISDLSLSLQSVKQIRSHRSYRCRVINYLSHRMAPLEFTGWN